MNFTLPTLFTDLIEAWTTNFWSTAVFWAAVGLFILYINIRSRRKRGQQK